MPIDIDNTDVSDITIDGQNVSEVTADGNVVWNAIPDGVVENFEEVLYGDRGNSLSDYYSGNLSTFSRVSGTPAAEGDYYLSASGVNNAMITTTSGPNATPSKGDTFAADLLATGTSDASDQVGIMFGVPSAVGWGDRDGYNVNLSVNGGEISLFDHTTNNSLDTASVSTSVDSWYTVRVDWGSDDVISVLIKNGGGSTLGTLSATDSTNASETGFGWVTNDDNGDEVRFDNYRLIG